VEGEVETAAARPLDRNLWSEMTDTDPLVFFEYLVDRLLSPERIRGVTEDLRQPEVLREHLMRVLALTERTAWFITALIKGLL
jgi:hypothetical protein